MNQGEDRTVKTTFTIKLLGHIVPDSVNSNVASIRKYFSKASVRFSIETAGSTETMTAKLQTPEKSSGLRFYDINEGRVVVNNISLFGNLQEGVQLPAAERDYLLLNTVLDTNTNTNVITPGSNTVTFTNQTIATPPSGYPTPGISDFIVYVSGLRIEPAAINSITQVGSNIVITFNAGLNFSLSVGMEILLIGKILN
jgi:hypothetical protein